MKNKNKYLDNKEYWKGWFYKKVTRSAAVTMLLVSMLLFSACGQEEAAQTAAPDGGEKLSVVTTIFPPYDFVSKIGGEYVEVTMLLKPGMESHSYEPTPRDIISITESDLFLYAGGESDVWVEELLLGNDEEVQAFSMLDWVDPLEEETSAGMLVRGHDHDHEEGDHEGHDHEGEVVHLDETEYDEHTWTSPKNAKILVDHICEEMIKLDPERENIYRENAEKYEKELEALDQEFEKAVSEGKRSTLVFGDRFPFLYFTKTYGLTFEAAFPGCSSETEPSAATIAYLIDKVKEEKIPVILYPELSNHRIADAIAEATGAKTAMFHSCHTLTKEELERGEDYISLMRQNLEVLKEALN